MNVKTTNLNILDADIKNVHGAIGNYTKASKSARVLKYEMIAAIWEFSVTAFADKEKRNVLFGKFKACQKKGMKWLDDEGKEVHANKFMPVVLFFFGKSAVVNGNAVWQIDNNDRRYSKYLRWLFDQGCGHTAAAALKMIQENTLDKMANEDTKEHGNKTDEEALANKAKTIVDHYSEHPVASINQELDGIDWVNDLAVVVLKRIGSGFAILSDVTFNDQDGAKNRNAIEAVVRKVQMPNNEEGESEVEIDDAAYADYDKQFAA